MPVTNHFKFYTHVNTNLILMVFEIYVAYSSCFVGQISSYANNKAH